MKRRFLVPIATIAIVLLTAASVQTGGIKIVVTDSAGAPLPGAVVTIRHDAGTLITSVSCGAGTPEGTSASGSV